MVRIAISLIVLVLLTIPAVGQNFSDAEQLSKVKAVRVVVIDHVRDGCLPNADALKTEAEQVLRRSGIKVVETKEGTPHQLLINMVGGEMKRKGEKGPIPMGACTAAVATNLLRDEYLRNGSVGRVQAFMIMGYTFVMKDQFEQQLRAIINEYVSALANAIVTARQK